MVERYSEQVRGHYDCFCGNISVRENRQLEIAIELDECVNVTMHTCILIGSYVCHIHVIASWSR